MPDINVHVVNPTAPHTHTIILLHGRGSTATEFASEFFESQTSDDRFLTDIFPSYKWIFPCAALRYARTDDEEMHQWFDMESVQEPSYDRENIQLPGLRESVAFIVDVVKKEAAEIGGLHKVFLGGISQGCATAITALLTVPGRMAGFIGFSGWCPFDEVVRDGDTQALVEWVRERVISAHAAEAHLDVADINMTLQTPMLIEHARDDEVVPVALGGKLRERLRELGANVQWVEYEEGAHWINEPDGIDDMVRFMASQKQ
jgi:lysophospholipase-2